jgi:hypothetical protein
VAMMTLDKTLHVTDYNMGAEKIFGWKKEEIIGIVFYNIFLPNMISLFLTISLQVSLLKYLNTLSQKT